jgi:hypothetical protein
MTHFSYQGDIAFSFILLLSSFYAQVPECPLLRPHQKTELENPL